MNLPNRLTLLRIILVPLVCALILYPIVPDYGVINRWLVCGLMFGAASITDALDGRIARKRGLVTDFGKLLDPVADKILVIGVFVCFTAIGLCSPWIVIIVLLREFMVTSMRMVEAGKGVVIPANNWGKAKTITQIAAIVLLMTVEYAKYIINHFAAFQSDELFAAADVLAQSFLWLSAAITLISGAIYLYQSRAVFKDT
ncbi:MAG: CDP-diacylglycerol--glycerol-3-phosphate 3-phosphatidyltransferase [Oscillospiraceae bacterium]|nr:CDP-diacylglycerol--glycerol-3-phosphate 3-phosphatidyltransferase [Oscillospiraceae bacterium]